FATFPGSNAAEDGVVIHYKAFGRVGDLSTKYNYGRSATHEIGHWFQLIHIWGDSPDCSIDDQVDDTPMQADANYCCPKYPKFDGCTSGGDGIMFMNYMDYSDDKFMQFFTPDQIERMDTAINQYRSALFVSPGIDEVSMRNVDLSLEDVTNPVRETIVRCFAPVVKLKNRGASIIHGFELVYGMHEGIPKHISYADSLISGAEIQVTLPEIAGKNGQNILEVRITATDSNTVNNFITRSFYSREDNAAGCNDDDPLIYPNPVMGTSFCVKSNFTKTQKMTIRLVSTLGQAVYETEVTSNPGDKFSVPSVNLPRGVYFLQLDGEDESRSKAIIIFPNGSSGDAICQ
ncbi:MAG: M43 family zinc metalloprotease, partial [Bacteroidota bacterium]